MQQSIMRPSVCSSAHEGGSPLRVLGCSLGAIAVVIVLLLGAPASGTRGAAVRDVAQAWTQSGRVSWYGPGFQGRPTASGEIFDANDLTMAHRSLPLGSEVRVTNLDNGRSVVLRVNDRGPYVGGRIADLSRAAAKRLDFINDGVVSARIELL
jgi:rare lipoprotein A